MCFLAEQIFTVCVSSRSKCVWFLHQRASRMIYRSVLHLTVSVLLSFLTWRNSWSRPRMDDWRKTTHWVLKFKNPREARFRCAGQGVSCESGARGTKWTKTTDRWGKGCRLVLDTVGDTRVWGMLLNFILAHIHERECSYTLLSAAVGHVRYSPQTASHPVMLLFVRFY